MRSKKRMLFGVVAASVSDIPQRELLSGIIEEAQKNNIDIAVISNIINENCNEKELPFENIIYELIDLPVFDGFIMLSEPFLCEKLKNKIQDLLSKKHTPIVIAGSVLPNFELPDAISINTSNEKDMEEAVDHLIEDHGFTDIDILTGYDSIEASHLRVKGYKNSLEKHGIPFDEKKLYTEIFGQNQEKNLQVNISRAAVLIRRLLFVQMITWHSDLRTSLPKRTSMLQIYFLLSDLIFPWIGQVILHCLQAISSIENNLAETL